MNSKPWLFGTILIFAGIAICYFGYIKMKELYIVVIALFCFVIFAVWLSSYGYFSDLETDHETTFIGIDKTIFLFAICLTAAICVGVLLANILKTITKAIVGGIAGFFIGFLLYNLVFAMIINSSPIPLWMILIITSAGGAFLMISFKGDKDAHVLPLVVIGAYMIIRGLSFFLGGYPDEAQTFDQLS